MALNKNLYKFLGLSAFVMCALFVVFSFVLYRAGGNYLAAVVVAAIEATAGVYLTNKSKQ
ncbi:MAG TPA: hypothetical protein VJT09_14230 [Pyrinomonadaceae bacterium]|nr:hypothetical protein [Pyrinomonadaceae bacterium]